jgi:hypothetical protein
MGILHEAGFDSREAAQVFRLLFTYIFGFAGLSPDQTAAAARRQAQVAIAVLPPEDYPNLTAAAAEASMAMAGEEQFEYGLERILDGLQARLDQKASRPNKPERSKKPGRQVSSRVRRQSTG